MNTTEERTPVSFALTADMQSFIDAAQVVARDVDMDQVSQRDGAASLEAALHAVAALHVDDLLDSLEPAARQSVLLQLACTLGAARPEAAWQGLMTAVERPVWQAMGEPFAQMQEGRVAWPVASGDGQARWVCWQPASTALPPAICLLQAHGERVVGPCTLADLQAAFDVHIEAPVTGLPSGQAIWIQTRKGSGWSSETGLRLATPGLADAVRRQHQAVLVGLLAGMTQRVSQAAYAYARVRQSGGKPLMHHQAVALRLADIAMNQQALWLYAQACFGGDTAGMTLSISHLHELASRVTRDGVQVAGAHGFVEGLPFKRLFEQTRSVLTALRTTACAVKNQAQAA